MRILWFFPLFLFFLVPPPVSLGFENSYPQISSYESFVVAADGQDDSASATEANESEEESESESETSRILIDDDDKLPNFYSWNLLKVNQVYSNYSESCDLEGVCRRLFKPPKA